MFVLRILIYGSTYHPIYQQLYHLIYHRIYHRAYQKIYHPTYQQGCDRIVSIHFCAQASNGARFPGI